MTPWTPPTTYARPFAAQGLDSTAVIARAQTAGKGRLGRSFQSPEGGLYLSALWQDCPAGQLLTATPLAAVAVCRAVESLCDTDCGIKWCNDVVLHGKKLCGILTESSPAPRRQRGVAGGRYRCQCGTGLFSAGHRGHGHIPCPTRA